MLGFGFQRHDILQHKLVTFLEVHAQVLLHILFQQGLIQLIVEVLEVTLQLFVEFVALQQRKEFLLVLLSCFVLDPDVLFKLNTRPVNLALNSWFFGLGLGLFGLRVLLLVVGLLLVGAETFGYGLEQYPVGARQHMTKLNIGIIQ